MAKRLSGSLVNLIADLGAEDRGEGVARNEKAGMGGLAPSLALVGSTRRLHHANGPPNSRAGSPGGTDGRLPGEAIMTTYSTRQVRTEMGEILRKVKEGETVILLEEQEAVAEIRPVETSPEEATLRELEEEGILRRPTEPRGELAPLADVPGALGRFLESRR